MAIKVIKHGETKFRAICPVCGCEFEYEYEDLANQYGIIKQVKCPDCGEWINHKEYTIKQPSQPTWPKIGDPIPCSPYVTWTTTGTGTELDCDKCPNKPDWSKPIVGDTPCTWCKKNQPYCFTGDKFPDNYKGGSYSVNPENFKHTIYTNENYTAPEFATNYTADIEDK